MEDDNPGPVLVEAKPEPLAKVIVNLTNKKDFVGETLEVTAGRYRIASKLGSGGQAPIYSAKLENAFTASPPESIAVKMLSADEIRQSARNQREIEIYSKTEANNHPGFARCLGSGYAKSGAPFLALEKLDYTLLQRINRHNLSLDETIGIIEKLSDAVGHLHYLGFVHRDLKPENVMFSEAHPDRPKLIDFGIAKDEKTGAKLTKTGEGLGTPVYMSPEQHRARKDAPADERSDIYSIGIIMFAMLTNKIPFEADFDEEDSITFALKVCTEKRPNPSDIKRSIPLSLSDIVLKCIEIEPAKRYQSTQELSKAFADYRKRNFLADFRPARTAWKGLKYIASRDYLGYAKSAAGYAQTAFLSLVVASALGVIAYELDKKSGSHIERIIQPHIAPYTAQMMTYLKSHTPAFFSSKQH